jgi:hypothetical protein
MRAQILVSADPLAADEGLRRRLDVVLALERFGLLARAQPAVVDREAAPLEQVLRLQAVGANMLVHHHPVENRLPAVAGRSRPPRPAAARRLARQSLLPVPVEPARVNPPAGDRVPGASRSLAARRNLRRAGAVLPRQRGDLFMSKHRKNHEPSDKSLHEDPGIGRSKGRFARTDEPPLEGDHTYEGDVPSDATPQGGVDPDQRGRTNE